MTNFRWTAVLALVGVLLSPIKAQEQADREIGPDDIFNWVSNADSIVVGTFRVGFPLPWFDGWHYSSQINVTDELLSEGHRGVIRIGWVRPYGVSCLICNDLRKFSDRNGIWFLQKRNDQIRMFGGTTRWCFAPLDLRHLKQIKEAIELRPGH